VNVDVNVDVRLVWFTVINNDDEEELQRLSLRLVFRCFDSGSTVVSTDTCSTCCCGCIISFWFELYK
jgi:hypothetical protein